MEENDHFPFNSIEKSIDILEKNIQDIENVSAWAKVMGYSRSHFSTSFSECFGESPFECLCRIRYEELQKIIIEYPHETSRAIAQRLGLQDEQALYKFLSRHFGTNFTELRHELLVDREY